MPNTAASAWSGGLRNDSVQRRADGRRIPVRRFRHHNVTFRAFEFVVHQSAPDPSRNHSGKRHGSAYERRPSERNRSGNSC
jgi:hypothetical protein